MESSLAIEKLRRILSVYTIDPGAALLRLHAFIEVSLRNRVGMGKRRYFDLIKDLRRGRLGDGPMKWIDDSIEKDLLRDRLLSNSVRHHDADLPKNVVAPALQRGIGLLQAIGLELEPEVEAYERWLKDKNASPVSSHDNAKKS